MSMIIPRGWIPRRKYTDAGQAHLNHMIEVSKPLSCPGVTTLFEQQAGKPGGTEKLRKNGRKAAGGFIGKLFAEKQAEMWAKRLERKGK